MRVVLIHRYFSPDTPAYAPILRSIGVRLADAGHDVTVLTCQPSYYPDISERAPRCEQLAPRFFVRRWPVLSDRHSALRKGINLVTFCLWIVANRLRLGRVDVVMAASTPPIAEACAGLWLARLSSARFVYHKQDIYPEVTAASGLIRSRLLERLLRWMDASTDRRADRVVVLSDDMAATEATRGVSPDRITVINNFDPWPGTDDVERDTAAVDELDGRLRVVFAGNLGRFQGLPLLIEAAKRLADDPSVVFELIGDGALRAQLVAEVRANCLDNVTFYGYRDPRWVAARLRRPATLGVVSLEAGVIAAAYPSKTLSYLKHGCPIVAVVEAESQLALELTEPGAGLQVDPNDVEGLEAAILKVASDRALLGSMAQAATSLYDEAFAPQRRLGDWAALFAEVAS